MSTPPATQHTQQSNRTSTTLSQQPTLVASPTRSTIPSSSAQQSQLCASPASRQPSLAFKNALTAFRNRMTQEELVMFRNTQYDEFCIALDDLQEEQRKRREMMNLSRIQGFLEGMQYLGRTIEVFVNANDMVAFIWGPIKFLLLVRAHLHSRDLLTTLFRLFMRSPSRSTHYLMHTRRSANNCRSILSARNSLRTTLI
jgi:hypothetical protein